MKKHKIDPATTRALVTVEVAERLVERTVSVLDDIDEGDLKMAPLSVVSALEAARALLVQTATETSITTCSMVKDQALSDEISHQASATVRDALDQVQIALAQP